MIGNACNAILMVKYLHMKASRNPSDVARTVRTSIAEGPHHPLIEWQGEVEKVKVVHSFAMRPPREPNLCTRQK